MTGGVQLFSCPRCRRGEFRSLPGQDGKAFCPWCGDAVSTVGSAPSSLPFSTEPTSLVELAERMAAAAPDPGSEAGLRARLEDSERRREQAETELRREQDKKQEIKKAVQQELGRLEAELTETKARLRKKDEDHASALDDLARLKDAREKDWAAEWKGIQNSLETSERARASFSCSWLISSQLACSRPPHASSAGQPRASRASASSRGSRRSRSNRGGLFSR